MSDSTNSSDIIFPLAPEELFGIYSSCLWTGAAAPNFADERTGVAVVKIANYVVSNPNITNATLAEFLGTTEDIATQYTNMFGGMAEGGFGDTMYWIGEVLQAIDHPETLSAVMPLYVVFTFLTTIVVALRMYSRRTIAGRILSFDWAILIGYILTLIWGALAVRHSQLQGKYSAFYDQSFNQYRDYMTYYFILFALYPFTVFTIKLSLLLFYFEMSSWRALRIAVVVTLIISLGNAIGSTFAWLFQCDKIRYWENRFTATCSVDITAITVSTSAINIVTDILIWGLPMPLVARLQLYPRERILAIFTFGFGAFACVASGFRLQSIREHVIYSWKSTSPLMIDVWTIIELNLAIICASAPALRALVVAKAPKILSSYGFGSAGKSGGSGNSSGIGRGRLGSYSLNSGPFAYKPKKSSTSRENSASRKNSPSPDEERGIRNISPSRTQKESFDMYTSEKPPQNRGRTDSDRTESSVDRSRSRGKDKIAAATGSTVVTYGGAYSAQVETNFNYTGAVPLRPPRPAAAMAKPLPPMPPRTSGDSSRTRPSEESHYRRSPRTPNGRRAQTGWTPVGEVIMV